MNSKEIWKKAHCSICQIIHRKNERITSVGTGFKIKGYIITNNHIFDSTHSDKITVQFKDQNGVKSTLEKEYNVEEWIQILKEGLPKHSWDFAVLEDPFFQNIPSLELAVNEADMEIGQKCSFLGFPLSSNYLTIHEAIISAKYTNSKNNVKYIQLDASVNAGNSGGPLINIENLKVVGVITLKKTGFSEKFKELNESFKTNIDFLDGRTGAALISGVDVNKTFGTIQHQFAILGKELERSSNVGIGFAFQLDEIRKSVI